LIEASILHQPQISLFVKDQGVAFVRGVSNGMLYKTMDFPGCPVTSYRNCNQSTKSLIENFWRKAPDF
jgi:hypothetical protein